MPTPKDKFAKMLADFEEQVKAAGGTMEDLEIVSPPTGQVPDGMYGGSKKAGSSKQPMNPQQAKQQATAENASQMTMMGPQPVLTNWIVQLHVDMGTNLVHFQAKPFAGEKIYTKWYEVVDPAITKKLMSAYIGSDKYGSSFAGTPKQYMICTRVDETTVNIPGYGSYIVAGLFGKQEVTAASEPVVSTDPVDNIQTATLEEITAPDVVEEDEEEDDDEDVDEVDF